MQNDELKLVAQKNKEYDLLNLHPEILTIPQTIRYLYVFSQNRMDYYQQICLLEENLFNFTDPEFEKNFSQKIHSNNLIAGYGEGISRIILYWIYKQNVINQQNIDRFKFLF